MIPFAFGARVCVHCRCRGACVSRTQLSALAALSSVLLAAASAGAQEPRASARDVVAVTARVERVDVFSRSLTLKTADGIAHVVYVGPELAVFRELKTGDNVLVRIVESVIVEARPGAKTTGFIDTTADAKKGPEAAQGDVVQQLKAVVTVESVDLPMRMIVYRGGDNRRVQRQVSDPRLLDGLKAGDVIEITYTRERAIALQRQP
jgi:Cu/Ag efflux protein CusF